MLRSFYITIFSVLYTVTVCAANQISDVLISPTSSKTRVVFDMPQAPKYTYFTLTNPDRLVIDFTETSNKFNLNKLKSASKLVRRVRYSKAKNKSSARVVIDLNKRVKTTISTLLPTGSNGHRVVVDLLDPQPPQTSKVVIDSTNNKRDRDIIVALDAGHGGTDPGSIGPAGTYEKRITLSIAKYLKQMIDDEPGMRAVMTRSGDYYISPNRRPEIAREHKADLLISIHADAFTQPKPRGGSVWVLSMGRADSELGRWLEKTERHSELLGGAAEVISDNASERYLAETILGLSMDHSMSTSYDLSDMVIDELKGVTRLHKRRPQAASLAVLTAPDIPSILVEVGFISNPQEEKNLNWAKYRKKLALALFKASKRYFRATPPDGTLWAKQKQDNRTHKVRSGESLSLLAQRYNVKISSIKKANNLRSDVLKIGQVLTIPHS